MNPASNTSALQGIKVIDHLRYLGGPYAGQISGDHGADVLKIEPPQGDETRHWGPPFENGVVSYFKGINRNKRSMRLDLTQTSDRQTLLNLLADADVLLENFKTGTLEKWGLGYDTLAQKFPRLIHCRVSGYGADGPLGGLPGYDAAFTATPAWR
jgi:crotonobetainyl-CoA:carnitine CoA-transferase CaiB-like acyl-CoA transferase